MFEGKTAVITGGSQGIGKVTALKMAEEGANIVVLHMGTEEDAAAACAEMEACAKENGHEIKTQAIRMDVADFAKVKEVVGAIHKEFGSIDILVNCAGITRDGLIAMMKEDNFDAVINVNLKGTFNMIRHCTPFFIKQKGGAIINVSSVSGIMGNAGQANYSTSKAGVIGLTKSTAKELVARGVRCNAVAPGFVATDMTANLSKNNPLIDAIPMKR
ncbi:MAG: SDR family NAD(P)-dependent oxidoreductase, partial [Bacillota bacterium]|nr:SDR family NAD(P)-dependent oxidoreductase [Bacillota bacterium]